MRRVSDIGVIKAEVTKYLKILLCYPMELVFWCVFPVVWVVPFIFQGKALVGGLTSQSFARLTGTDQYIPYVLIGAILNTYVMSALYGMGESLRSESYWGTLEIILGSPSRRVSILIGKALAESIMTTGYAISQSIICVVVFGLEVTVGKILPILLVVALLICGLYGLAMALAAVTLQIKESHSLVHTIEYFFYLFSPVRYPVDINPYIKMVSLVIPITYALIVVRGIMLLNQSIETLWRNVFILFIMDILFLLLGFATFTFMEKRVRQSGTMGHY